MPQKVALFMYAIVLLFLDFTPIEKTVRSWPIKLSVGIAAKMTAGRRYHFVDMFGISQV